jgi:hypothetical protein
MDLGINGGVIVGIGGLIFVIGYQRSWITNVFHKIKS